MDGMSEASTLRGLLQKAQAENEKLKAEVAEHEAFSAEVERLLLERLERSEVALFCSYCLRLAEDKEDSAAHTRTCKKSPLAQRVRRLEEALEDVLANVSLRPHRQRAIRTVLGKA